MLKPVTVIIIETQIIFARINVSRAVTVCRHMQLCSCLVSKPDVILVLFDMTACANAI